MAADGETGPCQATAAAVCEVPWTEFALDRSVWKALEASVLLRTLRSKAVEAPQGRMTMRED